MTYSLNFLAFNLIDVHANLFDLIDDGKEKNYNIILQKALKKNN